MMQMMKSLVFMVLLGMGVLTLSACGDKQKEAGKDAAPAIERQQSTQSPTQKARDIAVCNTYFTQMQTCVNSRITSQDQQQLETSLSFLKEQIGQLDNHEQIAQICQKSHDTIEAQKKQFGCV